ncbi:MAG: flagellar biosynthetic protein FliR [Polyangiaceae bacterium]|nr:flagellar biosynthetic protein FliR [Polyangiaceae bacterium]
MGTVPAELWSGFGPEAAELHAWGIAFARLLPTMFLLPAFGLGLMPTSVRWAIGGALALALCPAILASGGTSEVEWGAAAVARAMLSGMPVAVSAAVPLWVAITAGGMAHDLLGQGHAGAEPAPCHIPLGFLFLLVGSFVFLQSGALMPVLARLAAVDDSWSLIGIAEKITAGISLAVAVAAPIAVAAVVVDLTLALMQRQLPNLSVSMVLAPVRAVVLLGAVALSLDGMLWVLSAEFG